MSIQPILYTQVRNSLEMADVARDDREATGQRYGANSEVSVSQRGAATLQLGSQLTVAMCGGAVKREYTHACWKDTADALQEEIRLLSHAVGSVE